MRRASLPILHVCIGFHHSFTPPPQYGELPYSIALHIPPHLLCGSARRDVFSWVGRSA